MAWIYNVKQRTFTRNGIFEFKAKYAGSPGYKDDPLFECEKNKGPLPRGKYRITGIPFMHPIAGKFTLRLVPDVNNKMCGRFGFLIHGDSTKNPGRASNGCIVVGPLEREKIWNSKDKEVIVE